MRGRTGRKKLVFFVIAALAIVSIGAFAAAVPTAKDLQKVVPGAKSHQHKMHPLDLYIMNDSKGKNVGTAFLTSKIPPEVGGYRDEIDVLVGIDARGKITGVSILEHKETPEYIQKIIDSPFLKRFIGKGVSDDYTTIEVVTGATISSEAIRDDIRTSVETVFTNMKKEGGIIPAIKGLDLGSFLGPAAVIALVIASLISCFKPHVRYLRVSILVFSIAVVGFWLNSPITIGNFVYIRFLGDLFSSNFTLAFLIVVAIVLALVRGNIYCSYLCPFGALQRGAAGLKLPKIDPGPQAKRAAGWIRWLVAIATLYAIVALGSSAFQTIEPFALCFSRNPGAAAIVQTGVVLVAALFVRRIWCRFLCPTGLILDIISMFGAKIRSRLHFHRGA